MADRTKDKPAIRQRAFGRMGMAASLGFVVGPALAGLLGSTSWGPRLPLAVAAVAEPKMNTIVKGVLRGRGA